MAALVTSSMRRGKIDKGRTTNVANHAENYLNYVKNCKKYKIKPLPFIASDSDKVLTESEIELHKHLMKGETDNRLRNSVIFMSIGMVINIIASILCALTKPSEGGQ